MIEARSGNALVVMGVSGSGKSTLGAALADRLGWTFIDADDLHPPANRAKMAAGHPLTDEDRAPWLARVAEEIAQRCSAGVVVACSALKRVHRDRLRIAEPSLKFVYLNPASAVLEARLQNRRGHFMPPALLASQLATLEPPQADEAVIAPPDGGLDAQVAFVVDRLGST